MSGPSHRQLLARAGLLGKASLEDKLPNHASCKMSKAQRNHWSKERMGEWWSPGGLQNRLKLEAAGAARAACGPGKVFLRPRGMVFLIQGPWNQSRISVNRGHIEVAHPDPETVYRGTSTEARPGSRSGNDEETIWRFNSHPA